MSHILRIYRRESACEQQTIYYDDINHREVAAAPSSFSQDELYEFLIIFALIIILRIRRTINGQRFSNRIFTLPVLYTIIMIFFFVYLTALQIAISVILAIVAIPLGLRISENPEFFYRNQILYFKRSVLLTIIWLGGFIIRIFFELFYSTTNNLADFIITALLAFTLGLIIGERVVIYRKGNIILRTGKIEEKDEFQASAIDEI